MMLKKARRFTRPTLAATSPARPESAKPVSSPRGAPYPKQGRSERSSLSSPWLAWMSPKLRASNEGLLSPRVARAQGTHQANTFTCWRTFSASCQGRAVDQPANGSL